MLESHLDHIKQLCVKYEVSKLYVFGSILTESFNEKSDIDFLITFSPDLSVEDYTNYYFELHQELQTILDRNIDLVTERSLQNPFLIKNINRSRKLLYDAA